MAIVVKSKGKGNVNKGEVEKLIAEMQGKEFAMVFGTDFLPSGYSLEEGLRHAIATGTISKGLLRKVTAAGFVF